jgi:hypothetical protein
LGPRRRRARRMLQAGAGECPGLRNPFRRGPRDSQQDQSRVNCQARTRAGVSSSIASRSQKHLQTEILVMLKKVVGLTGVLERESVRPDGPEVDPPVLDQLHELGDMDEIT